jgi:hypothetical protein
VNRTIAAAVITMLVATTTPSLAVSQEAKTADECGKYLTEICKDLNTLEALVPNVPPEEASYIEKEYGAAIASGTGKRIYDIEHRLFFAAWNLHNAFNDARENVKLSRPIGSSPYRAKAGCTTSVATLRTRLAPSGMMPALSWS